MDGKVNERQSPTMINCHYLITAWSPSSETPQVEATIEEHELLYKAISALVNHNTIVPRKIYYPNPLPAGFPLAFADMEIPAILLPPEGFDKISEFYTTMGLQWKPMIYLIVTLPVVRQDIIAGTNGDNSDLILWPISQ